MHGLEIVIDNPQKRCYIGISWFEEWDYSIDGRGILTIKVGGIEPDGKRLDRTYITNNWVINIIPNPKGEEVK